MRRAALWIGVAALVLVVAVFAAVKIFHPRMLPKSGGTPAAANPETQLLNRGEYLARAGDCVACHTAPTGKEFAGGRAMPTPFGNLYVPNITPDDDTGIGKWSTDDFYRLMHTGISRDG